MAVLAMLWPLKAKICTNRNSLGACNLVCSCVSASRQQRKVLNTIFVEIDLLHLATFPQQKLVPTEFNR